MPQRVRNILVIVWRISEAPAAKGHLVLRNVAVTPLQGLRNPQKPSRTLRYSVAATASQAETTP